MKPLKHKRVVVYIPEDLYNRFRAKLIAEGGTSVSEWARRAMREELTGYTLDHGSRKRS